MGGTSPHLRHPTVPWMDSVSPLQPGLTAGHLQGPEKTVLSDRSHLLSLVSSMKADGGAEKKGAIGRNRPAERWEQGRIPQSAVRSPRPPASASDWSASGASPSASTAPETSPAAPSVAATSPLVVSATLSSVSPSPSAMSACTWADVSVSMTSATALTTSSSRRFITFTPWVARPIFEMPADAGALDHPVLRDEQELLVLAHDQRAGEAALLLGQLDRLARPSCRGP